MAKLVFHVDDSIESSKEIAAALKSAMPDVELKHFSSGSALLKTLETFKELPYMVLIDPSASQPAGLEVVAWMKRHPRIHVVPVVMTQTNPDPASKELAAKAGAFATLVKPLQEKDLTDVIRRFDDQAIPAAELHELDQGFADEVIDMTDEMHRIASTLNENSIKDLYRIFHTVKGGAKSLQFPHFGELMHLAEGFLTAVTNGGLYQVPQISPILKAVFSYIETQAEQIKAMKPMDLPPAQLIADLELVKANVAAGWSFQASAASGAQSSAAQSGADQSPARAEAVEPAGVVSRTSSSVRVSNEKMDELQRRFKRLQQLRVKLSTFSNQLKAEFQDEPFIQDLMQIVSDMTTESAQVMDFFFSLRVVPATKLKAFSSRVVAQASDQLGKPVRIEFSSETNLEIDQVVLEALEGGLTHILRNAVDHGLESVEKRTALGKAPAGLIRFDIRSEGKDQLVAVVQDDGGGINVDALKAAMLKKGVVTQEVMDRMAPEQVYDLIFVDGLSTKEQISDVSGRGVGLSAVKESITHLGGTIVATSELGKGTRFTIKTPRIFRL